MGKKRDSNIDKFLEEDDSNAWVVTYSDLMTLLLVFFILLFSISNLNEKKFEQVLESIKVSLKSDLSPLAMMEVAEVPDRVNTKIRIDELTGLKSRKKFIQKDIESYIEKEHMKDDVFLNVLDDKIIVEIRGATLFDSGRAKLKDSALPVLDKLISIFDAYNDYKINIKGHTDNVPISTIRFPSNWELSAIRATNVLRYLIQKGISPVRLTATGYGSIMPLRPNSSQENRAANRRVEFVLEKQGY